MSTTVLKVLSLAASAGGVIISLFADWVDDKVMDKKIEEKVNEALAEKNDEEES